jgi:copper ion binding protein
MMLTEKFHVPGISCHHCVNAIKQEVSELEGVQSVEGSVEEKTVTVAHSEQVSLDAIIAAINEAGYDEVAKL